MTVAPPKLVADTTWSWWTIHPIQQLALAVLKRVGCHQHHPVVLFVVDDDGMGGHDEIRLVRVDVDEPFRLRRDPSGDAYEAVLWLASDSRPSCNHGGEGQLQVGSV